MFSAAKQAGLNIGILSALIQAGTLDKFCNKTRTHLVYEAQLWNRLSPKEKQIAISLGPKYDFAIVKIVKAMNLDLKDEKSKPFIKNSRMKTITTQTKPYKAIFQQNSTSESFANWWYEKRLLGYVMFTTLLRIFQSKKASLVPISEALEEGDGRYVDFIGSVDEDPTLAVSRTAKKSRYAKYSISDEGASIKVMIFNNSLDECKALNDGLPKEGDIVIVNGVRKGDDTVFANSISAQQNQIYTKLSELKDSDVLD